MPRPSILAASAFAYRGSNVDELMKELSQIQISCDYQKTLALLRALKAGTVSLDNVTMTADGWTVAEVEPPEKPAEPPEEGE